MRVKLVNKKIQLKKNIKDHITYKNKIKSNFKG